MGASTIEKGVLKLVHPGRHVEYHRRSTTAAEIMKKNPRHSITRPDFFKNPFIVVSPESIMVPGQVFYIVPNKTIHKLIKNQSQQHFDQPSLSQSPNTSHRIHNPVSKHTSPSKRLAGRTPIYQFCQDQEESSSCAYSQPQSLTFQARDFYLALTTNYGQRQKQSTNLKSCRKKEGSFRVSANLRVTFDFSTKIHYC